MILKPGTILVFHVAYQDCPPDEVLREFDQAEVLAEYHALWRPGTACEDPTPDLFMEWLEAEGYIKPMRRSRAVNWSIGSTVLEDEVRS